MAGDKAVSTVSKPAMRALLNGVIKRNICVGLGLAAISAVVWHQTISAPRKRRYAEFYRTYDAEKEFEEMRQKGLFQSC